MPHPDACWVRVFEEFKGEEFNDFNWWCEYQNTHHKDTCFKELGLCLEFILITLHSIVNING